MVDGPTAFYLGTIFLPFLTQLDLYKWIYEVNTYPLTINTTENPDVQNHEFVVSCEN